MEKTIYYTVELDVTPSDMLSGDKEVTIYDMVDNKPKPIHVLEIENCKISDLEIEKYLDQNNMFTEYELLFLRL